MKHRKPSALTMVVIVTLLVCTLLMAKSSEDKLAATFRAPIFDGWFERFTDGNQIVFNLAVGLIASFVTYLLTTKLPELQKRRRLRLHLVNCYEDVKRGCLRVIVGTLEERFDGQIVEQLLDKTECRRFFNVSVSESQTRWHQFMNNLDDSHLQELHFEMEKLVAEVNFVLLSVDVDDTELFVFLNRLKYVCRWRMFRLSKEYDDVKSLSGFLWEILSGWDFIDGYKNQNKIEVIISSI